MNKPVDEWIPFNPDKIETKPIKYGKYLICRKDGNIHFERWNCTGWAYNHNEIEYYAFINLPKN